jgi:hypothetical protein
MIDLAMLSWQSNALKSLGTVMISIDTTDTHERLHTLDTARA